MQKRDYEKGIKLREDVLKMNNISKESQEAYKQFKENRIEEFDYKNADSKTYLEMTKSNTKAIEECASNYWDGVQVDESVANGVPVEEIKIEGADSQKYIYYIHGGGFVQGEAAWGHFCAVNIAKKCNRNLVLVNYRLAPDHPFPAGINDCITAYEWMLKRGIKADNIVFLGESAGGNLVLATAIGCKQRSIPLPAGIAAISPVVDLNFCFSSYRERRERECILPYNQNRFAQHEYMEDKDFSNPLASPLFGDCEGLPPVFIGVSTEEILFDDSIHMHEKLLKEGVDSRLVVWENMWHTFYMMDFPESWTVFEQVSDFFLSL